MNQADTYREWPPPAAWRHVVVCCWEHHVPAGGARQILPDGCADLLLFESGSREVVGLHDEVATPVFAAGTRLRGIRFRPEAVGPGFGVDAATLRNQTVALADVLGARRAHLLDEEARIDAWIRSIELDRRAAGAVWRPFSASHACNASSPSPRAATASRTAPSRPATATRRT